MRRFCGPAAGTQTGGATAATTRTDFTPMREAKAGDRRGSVRTKVIKVLALPELCSYIVRHERRFNRGPEHAAPDGVPRMA